MDIEHDNMGTIVEEDRLSRLPNDVIHHILSFMDIKFAIQTSSLSPRWKFVWTSMPCLNFSSEYFPTLTKFSRFVTHVLSRRNNQTEVSSVKLRFHGNISQLFVRKIIDYAVSHSVQEFSISCLDNNQTQFPLSLFSSQTLKCLSLSTCHNEHCITPTSPWDLPNLTTLHLHHITLRDDNTDNRLGIFIKCVNLKKLTLDHFTILGRNVFSICTTSLTDLTLSNFILSNEFMTPQIFVVSAPKLKNVNISHSSAAFSFVAPGLSSLLCEGSCPPQLYIHGSPSLDEVRLLFNVSSLDKENVRKTVSLLREVRSAKFLTVNAAIIESLSTYPDLLAQPSPFTNLRCLEIHQNENAKKKVTMSTQLRNYLLDKSPSAIIIMDSPEEGRAGKKVAGLAMIECIMTEVQALVEQWKDQIKRETGNHELQLQRIARAKREAAIMRAQFNAIPKPEVKVHLVKRVAEFQSHLAELELQIHNRESDTTSNAITSQKRPRS